MDNDLIEKAIMEVIKESGIRYIATENEYRVVCNNQCLPNMDLEAAKKRLKHWRITEVLVRLQKENTIYLISRLDEGLNLTDSVYRVLIEAEKDQTQLEEKALLKISELD